MLWLPAVLIAAVSNLDNLAVGVAFGMRGTRITAAPNLIIAAVTMTATAAAMTSGRALADLIPSVLAASLGSVIIIAIGAWTVPASLSAVRAPARSRWYAPRPRASRHSRKRPPIRSETSSGARSTAPSQCNRSRNVESER